MPCWLMLKHGSSATPTRNVCLGEHFDTHIASGIEAGRYSNASEVVRDALRLLEDQEKLRALRIAALRRLAECIERAMHRTKDNISGPGK